MSLIGAQTHHYKHITPNTSLRTHHPQAHHSELLKPEQHDTEAKRRALVIVLQRGDRRKTRGLFARLGLGDETEIPTFSWDDAFCGAGHVPARVQRECVQNHWSQGGWNLMQLQHRHRTPQENQVPLRRGDNSAIVSVFCFLSSLGVSITKYTCVW